MTSPSSTRAIHRRMEAIEAHACADLYRGAAGELSRMRGIHHAEAGGALMMRVEAIPDNFVLNRAIGVGAPGADLQSELAQARRFFGGAAHVVAPVPDTPASSGAVLADAGYLPDYAWDVFSRGVEPPPQVRCDLAVHEAGPETAGAAGAVIAEAFGYPQFVAQWVAAVVERPGWTFFTAADGPEHVAAAAVYIHAQTAWLSFAATLPACRGRGAQGALFAARIRAAREAGCTLLVTETNVPGEDGPGPSYRNMLRMGFRPEYRRVNYRVGPATRRGGGAASRRRSPTAPPAT